MNAHTITPPREKSPIGADTQYGPDPAVHLPNWFESVGINIHQLIQEHNRIPIPILEDISFMSTLYYQLRGDDIPREEATPAYRLEPGRVTRIIDRFIQEIKKELAEAEKNAADRKEKTMYMRFPVEMIGDFHSFMRSRSAIATCSVISNILPHLREQLKTAERRAQASESAINVDEEEQQPQNANEATNGMEGEPQKVNEVDDDVALETSTSPSRKSKHHHPKTKSRELQRMRGKHSDGVQRSAVTKRTKTQTKKKTAILEGKFGDEDQPSSLLGIPRRRSARFEKSDSQ